MNVDAINLFFGFIACSISVGVVLWRVIVLKLNTEILLLQKNLELKDLQIENLQDMQTLLSRGLEERIEHFSARTKLENAESRRLLNQVIHFLAKTSDFEPRD